MSKIKKIKTQTQIQTHSKSNQTARQVSERRNLTHKQTRQMQMQYTDIKQMQMRSNTANTNAM